MTQRTATLAEAQRLVGERRLGEAEPILKALTQQRPDVAFGWFGLGVLALERDRPAEAARLFEHAVQRDTHQASYHHNLAVSLGRLGRFETAAQHFERAIALNPDYAEAYFNYANFRKFRDSQLVDQIDRRLIARAGDLTDAERVFWHFAAGKIADDLGQPDRAFPHFAAGNAAKGASFDPAAHARFVDATTRVFTDDLVARLGARGYPDERFVFVVGMPRSGTTLVEEILARHPAVHGAGERPDVAAIARELPGHLAGTPYPDCVPQLDANLLHGFGAAYARTLGGLAPGAVRIVDKHPINYRYLGLAALMLPRARFVHCRRDPVDTCLSCYMQNFRSGQEYAFDLRHLGHVYNNYRELMAFWRRFFADRICEIDYETLCRHPEAETRRLLAHVGLPYDPACLPTGGVTRTVNTASWS